MLVRCGGVFHDLMHAIDRFVAELSAAPMPDGLFNPYAEDGGAEAARCRHNLSTYLLALQLRDPAWLLVGEAPGYRGCRLTGIPFTSEAAIWPQHDPGNVGAFWRETATAWQRRPGDRPSQAEATATIVWRTLGELDLFPLLWNALPFHPHRVGLPDSNRTPSRKELEIGRPFLLGLMALFPAARPIAVGQKAGQALARWEQPAPQIRHPSHGGAHLFKEQLAQVTGRAYGSSEVK